ncbi:ABC transporter ATP-binding protein [Sphaerotilus mobilis]|uniref:Peptide/nickel transport system ATP-binding protein n=1 Tax=Sphaerotilus mobilis TaxID=47994 RepID=A0A4Q7LGN8_9BURK|nr:ABC transporter ATP-binding protein [Sphaerotilus mobilis]RZS53394.1 peptide/nickel transport system ATP-binding protein [Sphaerotilus mobilis]
MSVRDLTAGGLSVRGLSVHFETPEGTVEALDHVSLDIEPGKTLGLVGESGSGKSALASAIVGMVAGPAGRVVSGEVFWQGRDLLKLGPKDLRTVRGREIAWILQDPATALNPVRRIGDQVGEAARWHLQLSRSQTRARALSWLARVHLSDPERLADAYPHQLSGGMRQRALIAAALACGPQLLIADEPTSTLDVSVQAGILELLRDMRRDLGLSMLLITHALPVVAQMSDRIVVLYAGRVAEEADTQRLFFGARHPYTRAMIEAVPRPEPGRARQVQMTGIAGQAPSLIGPAGGCRYADRCASVHARCHAEAPPLREVGPSHRVACWAVEGDVR